MLRTLCATASLLLISATTLATAETYFVDPAGSNVNPGSQAQPWLTLQHAANNVQAGDTVRVLAGTYAGFNLTRSGAPDQPITFSAEPGVLVDTAAAGAHRSRINLDSVSHIVVEGFEVIGSNDQRLSKEGIRIVAPAGSDFGHIVIRNNHVHHNGDRNIFTGHVNHLTIENNVLHHAYEEHGLYISNSGDHHVVRNNVIYSNSGSGIHVNSDASEGGDGLIRDVLVDSNTISDNGKGGTSFIDAGGVTRTATGGGSGINLDGVQDSRFQNNVLHDNHASGLSLYQIDGAQPARNNVVANNTIVNAVDGRWALNIQDGSSGNTVLNNILFSLHTSRGALDIDQASLADLVSNYNLMEDRLALDGSFIGLAAWQADTGLDGHSLALDAAALEALFADFDTRDLQLVPDSTAVDAGTAGLLNGLLRAAPDRDRLGALRPAGPAYDIGAYELQPIPEPGTAALVTAGLLLLATAIRHRARRS